MERTTGIKINYDCFCSRRSSSKAVLKPPQTLARLPGFYKPREASGLRRVHRRFAHGLKVVFSFYTVAFFLFLWKLIEIIPVWKQKRYSSVLESNSCHKLAHANVNNLCVVRKDH